MPVNTKKYVDKYKIWNTNNLTNQKYKVQIFWEIQIKLMPADTNIFWQIQIKEYK